MESKTSLALAREEPPEEPLVPGSSCTGRLVHRRGGSAGAAAAAVAAAVLAAAEAAARAAVCEGLCAKMDPRGAPAIAFMVPCTRMEYELSEESAAAEAAELGAEGGGTDCDRCSAGSSAGGIDARLACADCCCGDGAPGDGISSWTGLCAVAAAAGGRGLAITSGGDAQRDLHSTAEDNREH